MGKTGKKPKVNIPEGDLKNLDEGIVSPKDLAEKHGVTSNTVSILKHKRKLKTSMQLKLADQAIANKQKLTNEQVQVNPPSLQVEKVYDYDTLVRGLWSGVDSILILVASLSRGQIVYERLTEDEIDKLTNASKNNTFIQKISTIDQLGTLILIGTIAVVFRGKLKLVHKHKEDDPKCKCEKCKLERKEIKQIDEKTAVIEKEGDKVELIVNELHTDQPNAQFDSNGLKIEQNIQTRQKTEQEVLEQNKKITKGQEDLVKMKW